MSNRGIITDWGATPGGKSWFLGIGIDDYANFPPLANGVRDMRKMHAVMAGRYDVTEDTSLLLQDQDATETSIIKAFEQLAEVVGPADKLLIYYSGHGHLNSTTGLAYWIPVDARKGLSGDYIANSTIRDHLSSLRAKHILLISDSCFSGSLFLRGGMRSSRAIEELEKTPSRWAMCSGRATEEVMDGQPGEHSPFAASLFEALESDSTAGLNASKLFERVREQTAALASQVPDGGPLRIEGHKGGQYVFRKAGGAATEEVQGEELTASKTSQYSRTGSESERGSAIDGGSHVTAPHPLMKRRGLFILAATALIILSCSIAFWPQIRTVLTGHTGGQKTYSDIQIVEFHTTTSVNENLWTAGEVTSFNTGQRVFIYGSAITSADTEIMISYDQIKDGVETNVKQDRIVIQASDSDPFRFSDYHVFRDTGLYRAKVYSIIEQEGNGRTEIDKLLESTEFIVRIQ